MECPDKLKKYCQPDGEGDQIRTTTFRHRHLQPVSRRLAAIFPVCAHTFHHRDGNNASINIYTAISSLHTRSTFTHGKNEVLDDGRRRSGSGIDVRHSRRAGHRSVLHRIMQVLSGPYYTRFLLPHSSLPPILLCMLAHPDGCS
jgi:hypothetical protein